MISCASYGTLGIIGENASSTASGGSKNYTTLNITEIKSIIGNDYCESYFNGRRMFTSFNLDC